MGVMMLALRPWWIEVVPAQIGTVTIRNWTSEADLFSEGLPYLWRGCPIQAVASLGLRRHPK
jgi:hypothetical protein